MSLFISCVHVRSRSECLFGALLLCERSWTGWLHWWGWSTCTYARARTQTHSTRCSTSDEVHEDKNRWSQKHTRHHPGQTPTQRLATLFGSPSLRDATAIRCRATLIANGEESLRVLQIKCTSLMPKKDTQLVRAALLIDHLSRNASINDVSGKCYFRTAIPVLSLAKAVRFQKKDMTNVERI